MLSILSASSIDSILLMLSLIIAILIVFTGFLAHKLANNKANQKLNEKIADGLCMAQKDINHMLDAQNQQHQKQTQQQHKYQIDSLKIIQDGLQSAIQTTQQQVSQSLQQHTAHLGTSLKNLTEQTQKQLHNMSEVVDQRLNKGFEKTNATFNSVIKRLSIIDAAQQKITELSSNVVSLQDILINKSARGAFGEVQLESLVRNQIPENNYSMQHTLSNGKRVDCLLFLPAPTGNVAIDSKFPLESYQRSLEDLTATQRKTAETQFKKDVRTHITAIAEKYIITGETAAGALMFIPAEAIFAHIHSNHQDLVDFAQQQRVWLTSPTTLMAVLSTARAVIKDDATRKQIHIIQTHLAGLSKDFDRFQKRMDGLAKHIEQVHNDVELVHKSSRKISSKFKKIENVNLSKEQDDEQDNADILPDNSPSQLTSISDNKPDTEEAIETDIPAS